MIVLTIKNLVNSKKHKEILARQWSDVVSASGVGDLSIENINVTSKDALGETPLHYAAGMGYIELAEFLIIKGADLEAKSIDGYTPYLEAISQGKEDLAKMLRLNGADILSVTNTGLTAEDLKELSELMLHKQNIRQDNHE